ncbi:MAG: hypothetical protein ACOYIK_10175 [Coriobacteriales bacterium]|jgi:hypothetical protein
MGMNINSAMQLLKKMLPLKILEILQERTNAGHTLSQREIQDVLESDYSHRGPQGGATQHRPLDRRGLPH